MRLRVQRRNQEGRRMSLMNAARMIQHRGSTSKSRISLMMEQNHRQELAKSEEIEKVVLSTYFDNFEDKSFHSLGM